MARRGCARNALKIREQERFKAGVDNEIGALHKTNALLIATQFAANHECEFDASDAMAAIIERVEKHIATLDELSTEAP